VVGVFPTETSASNLGHGDSLEEKRGVDAKAQSRHGRPRCTRETNPTTFETLTFGCTPRLRSKVAHICCKSWKRISGKPAFLSSGLKEFLTRFCGLKGVPTLMAKIRSRSAYGPVSLIHLNYVPCVLPEAARAASSLISNVLHLVFYSVLLWHPKP
jgi:hypothetical protein